MSRIRSKDTKPEIRVRSILHKMGYRFRLHRNDLPGKPDIVLPKYKSVIFVNGCFWHRHENCKYATTPKSNEEFWNRKFSDTVARDKRNWSDLEKLGWRVHVVWQCQLNDVHSLENFFSKNLVL
jgi:DNA mismatch endonuclease (patch repair protein)